MMLEHDRYDLLKNSDYLVEKNFPDVVKSVDR